MAFKLTGATKVTAVHEHFRTVYGRREPATGKSFEESINLGYFIHTDLDLSFGAGAEKPDVKEGDTLKITLEKL